MKPGVEGNFIAYTQQVYGLLGKGLETIPEPATMLLLGSGPLGVAGLRRKFKK